MVGQIQSSDRQSTPHESAPETLESLSLSDSKCPSYEEPFQDNGKISTSTADNSANCCGSSNEDETSKGKSVTKTTSYYPISSINDLSDKGFYFQVNTPSGIPMRVLFIPYSGPTTVVSRSWINREGNKMIQCPKARMCVLFRRHYTTTTEYKVTMKSGMSSIESIGYVVPHIQDGIDVVLGTEFWDENLPMRFTAGPKLSIIFNSSPGDPKRFLVKAAVLEDLRIGSSVVLPEL